jgi:hypothetical protein
MSHAVGKRHHPALPSAGLRAIIKAQVGDGGLVDEGLSRLPGLVQGQAIQVMTDKLANQNSAAYKLHLDDSALGSIQPATLRAVRHELPPPGRGFRRVGPNLTCFWLCRHTRLLSFIFPEDATGSFGHRDLHRPFGQRSRAVERRAEG